MFLKGKEMFLQKQISVEGFMNFTCRLVLGETSLQLTHGLCNLSLGVIWLFLYPCTWRHPGGTSLPDLLEASALAVNGFARHCNSIGPTQITEHLLNLCKSLRFFPCLNVVRAVESWRSLKPSIHFLRWTPMFLEPFG